MADGITVEARNGPAFTACIDAIARDVAEPRDAVTAAGRELVTVAAAAAPRRTGRLAGSHRLVPATSKSVRVTVDAAYAAVIHWGWPGHNIHRQPWIVATWLRDRRPMDAATGAVQAGIDKAAART